MSIVGYWTCKNFPEDKFRNSDEFLRALERGSDGIGWGDAFYDWVDKNYTASEILGQLANGNRVEEEFWEEFEKDTGRNFVPGRNFELFGYKFTWHDGEVARSGVKKHASKSTKAKAKSTRKKDCNKGEALNKSIVSKCFVPNVNEGMFNGKNHYFVSVTDDIVLEFEGKKLIRAWDWHYMNRESDAYKKPDELKWFMTSERYRSCYEQGLKSLNEYLINREKFYAVGDAKVTPRRK